LIGFLLVSVYTIGYWYTQFCCKTIVDFYLLNHGKFMYDYRKLRRLLYEESYRTELIDSNLDLRTWKKHPYTKFKSHVYIEIASLIAIPCLYWKVHPNTITLVYASMGLLGILAYALGSDTGFWIGTLIFFFKSSLDWLDGFVARRLDKKSEVGAAFDEWGGAFNTACFQFATMLFLYNETGHYILLVALSLILLLNGWTFKQYSERVDKTKKETQQPNTKLNSLYLYTKKIYLFSSYQGTSAQTDLMLTMLFFFFYLGYQFIFLFIALWVLSAFVKFCYSILTVVLAR